MAKTSRKLTDGERAREASRLLYREMEERYAAIVSALPDLMIHLDRDGRILDCHIPSGFNTILEDHGVCGKTLYALFPADLADQYMDNVRKALGDGGTQSFSYSVAVDGKDRFREARIKAAQSRLEALVLVRDVTESLEAETLLREMSIKDHLTGLYNRRYFEEELHRLGSVGRTNIGIVVCDINGLKLVNDSLGHVTGDMQLRILAGILRKCLREKDVIARMGGDEFAVILPECDEDVLEQACLRIRREIDKHLASDRSIPLTVAIGFAMNHGQANLAEVLREADNNMYREKFHSSQNTRSAMVEIVMRLLKARDLITEQHVERIEDLLVRFGRHQGLLHNRLTTLRLLAKFHDIGKVGIPDRILFKPGKLTDEEYQEVKRHSEIGFRIAKASVELYPLADFILKHHERWDGKGYPLGLKGTEIPLEARMLAITDAFDAMTNDRPYRRGMSVEEAVAELRACAGTQFDPHLVEAFVQLVAPEPCLAPERSAIG